VSVSFRLYEYDFWQHLTLGKAIWQLKAVPRVELWTWPDYGSARISPSWGFSFLLWPFWALGGDIGLATWRWLTTLAVFGLLWKTARAMGVRQLPTLVVLVVCGLIYRQRSQIRPETLAAVLLAAELWLLETRTRPRSVRDAGLVLVAWVWVNVHISFVLGWLVLAIRALAGPRPGTGSERPSAAGLGPVLLLAVAVSFVNPFGWRAVWRPFEFAFSWRHDPLISSISELAPLDWSANLSNGLPLVMLGWPALVLWRWIRRGLDAVEFASCALFTALALSGNRFVATYAVVATPWLARDFDDWLGTRRARRGSERPWLVGLLTSATCVAMCLYEWTHFENPIGLHPDARHYPVAACDFIAANDVRGRGINDFYLGGYMLWRFWPDRSRLPFADIHPEDMPAATRLAYLSALHSERGWQQLDGSYHFDYALLSRSHVGSGGLLDVLDRRAEWALVFVDDVAALYVRRDGAAARVAATKAYRDLPGGETKLIELVMGCAKDPALARETRDELARQARSSPWSRRFAALARTLELSAAERAPNR
jgi:hypothetical protein